MKTVEARDVIESARRMARSSRDAMVPALRASGAINADQLIKERMGIVMDSYLTGAAEMLKMLCGDFQPEPWEDDYQHEPRIAHLLALAQSSTSAKAQVQTLEKDEGTRMAGNGSMKVHDVKVTIQVNNHPPETVTTQIGWDGPDAPIGKQAMDAIGAAAAAVMTSMPIMKQVGKNPCVHFQLGWSYER